MGQRGCQYCRKKWHRLRKELEGTVEVASVEVAQMRLVKGHSGSSENSAVTRPEPVRWTRLGPSAMAGVQEEGSTGWQTPGPAPVAHDWKRGARGGWDGKGDSDKGSAQHGMDPGRRRRCRPELATVTPDWGGWWRRPKADEAQEGAGGADLVQGADAIGVGGVEHCAGGRWGSWVRLGAGAGVRRAQHQARLVQVAARTGRQELGGALETYSAGAPLPGARLGARPRPPLPQLLPPPLAGCRRRRPRARPRTVLA